MLDARRTTGLVAHAKALHAAATAIRLVMRVPSLLKSIADQLICSARSVPANLAEGHGRSGRDRQHFWRIAYGSAKEADSHLRLLAHAGVIEPGRAADVLDAFDEVRAMPWRFPNPKASSRAHRRCRLPLSPGAAPAPVYCRCRCLRPLSLSLKPISAPSG